MRNMLNKCPVVLFILFGLFAASALNYADEAKTQYTVGVDDVLEISVREHDDLKTVAPVTSDGSISFPYIGSVRVKGMSLSEVEQEISKKLADGYIKYPVVSVKLSSSKSLKFFVYGEVSSPGRYVLEDDMTVLKAISTAGGIMPDGLYGGITLRRKQKEKQEYMEIPITLNRGKGGGHNGDMLIQAEDILVVERNKHFFVAGEILKPGKYTLEDGMTVLKAISEAGGITPDGIFGDVKLIRNHKDEQESVIINVDIKDTKDGGVNSDMLIQADDKIVVERNKIFYVYGEVLKPGKFTLEDNMTVLKAISLAGGFSKYGSPDRVKILRSISGKGGYESIKVDVKGAISGQAEKDILIEPDDVVIASEGLL